MILKNTLSVRFFVPLLFVSGLSAAPRLNLVQTSLTVSVPTGTNGPTYALDTFNIGDGTLNLQASSSGPLAGSHRRHIASVRIAGRMLSGVNRVSNLFAGRGHLHRNHHAHRSQCGRLAAIHQRHRASGRRRSQQSGLLSGAWRLHVRHVHHQRSDHGQGEQRDLAHHVHLRECGHRRLCDHRHRHRG